MIVLGSRTAVLSPPVSVVWKALMRPDLHPLNRGFAWPIMFEDATLPRIVESSEFDRVVWSSPWPQLPDILLQFDLRPETRIRWTLLAHTPAPGQQTVEWLRDQVSHLVNIDLRNATGY
ncbi:hypothetical protein CH275_07100 [Rhodococcus sp. 06-235-1A]|uniref:hypothetical protein n=1 Tax=Rhodococcus sp. 06-235-1A TaxID=2022508 RepID=UPI000B9B1A1F|nr:hypothetical protein [Rhodococcus sp. 06-235-1A]OZD06966.1 hypothetical protein CH275_07100 [Rhodococcus sp. 06-235-1A]